jgi:hypothetical protein
LFGVDEFCSLFRDFSFDSDKLFVHFGAGKFQLFRCFSVALHLDIQTADFSGEFYVLGFKVSVEGCFGIFLFAPQFGNGGKQTFRQDFLGGKSFMKF